MQWALGVRGEWRGAIAWKGWLLSSTLVLMSYIKLRKKTNRRMRRTGIVVASGCQERRHFRWTCFLRYTWDQLCRSVCAARSALATCVCVSVQRMHRFITRCISGCTLQNQPISEAKTTHDSITSNQRTQKPLRHFMNWSSWFCSTYKKISEVSFPKASTDPVSSLLVKSLHAMGAQTCGTNIYYVLIEWYKKFLKCHRRRCVQRTAHVVW